MRRNLFDHLTPEAALVGKILLKLEERCGFDGTISKRELERAMNANKQPRWAEAWRRLLRDKCVRVSAGPNRQQLISLLEIPDHLHPHRTVKKPRRRRGATEWFKERLPEFLRRDGYDERADAVEAEGWEDDLPPQYVPGDPVAR